MATGRVGIVTIVDHDNFGNRLQNFALQEALASQGWQVETIRNTPRPMRRSLLAARAFTALRTDGVVGFVRRNLGLAISRWRAAPSTGAAASARPLARTLALRAFTRAHVHELATDFEDSDPAVLAARYDRVVVGSDQVWNPGFRQANEVDFLTFVPPEKRVAYAASFGVSEIPTYLRPLYARWLTGIPHISVREDRGADIVQDLVGRHVPVVLDPTLLVDPSVWQERARVPECLRERSYLATFFLGGLPPAESAALSAHAASEGLEVVDLLNPDEPLAGMSPLDFVGAIRGARLLATDSFHACVFALVFERASITRARHADDTRLSTLFDLAGISRDRWEVESLHRTRAVDWQGVADRLADRRVDSWAYLDAAVGRPTTEQEAP